MDNNTARLPAIRPALLRTAVIAACAALLGACAVTKQEPPPPMSVPASFKEGQGWQRAAPPVATPGKWWTVFNDPVLDELQQRLVIGNENLKQALSQVASARATLAASRSALWPAVSGNLSANRSSSPQSGANVSVPSSNVTLGVDASWEIDLWGRLSMAAQGARDRVHASEDDLAAVRLSAQATLAQTYFALRVTEAQQALLARAVEAYARSLDLTQARYESGVAGLSDVLQAQTQLKSAQAQVHDAAAQRAQLEHAIAVLVGEPPALVAIAATSAVPAPPTVPELLPATLLERRPDIAAAQRRVAAAYSDIGVADAAYFPSLTLSASGGWRSTVLGNLSRAPQSFWALGAGLALDILDSGRRKLASDQARAAADAATSAYRQTVLTALQEVEDNLVLAQRLGQEAALQQEALDAAQRNLQITLDRYRAGTVSYLEVVLAQTAAFTSERTLLDVRNRQLAATNQLLKNIAGSWQSPEA
jgi:NodT family efflux transporter outer membrane factor (OMF) lipoprotein